MKVAAILMDAHIHNVMHPGTYSERAKQGLIASGMPPVNLPPVTSMPLMKFVETIETNIKQARQPDQQMTTDIEDTDAEQEDILVRHLEIGGRPHNITDYKVNVYANKETFIPKDITPQELTTFYRAGKIKLTIEQSRQYKPEYIDNLLNKQRLCCNKQDFKMLPPTDFRKIRSLSRTPDRPAKQAKKRVRK